MRKIALVGNPNSGKTTLFNKLTGGNQHIGNWPGVTVEKKEGFLKLSNASIKMVDLPGIYSLSTYSSEEKITREYILKEKPDLLLNIIDASNLERNLYLSTQLAELGINIIYVLNMMDVIDKNGVKIDTKILSEKFGQSFIEISASRNIGMDELYKKIDEKINTHEVYSIDISYYRREIRQAIENILNLIQDKDHKEFIAVKILENDPEIIKDYSTLSSAIEKAEEQREKIEKQFGDDIESLIIIDRYDHVSNIIGACLTRTKKQQRTFADKLDTILLNKFLSLPIFLFVMFAIFSVTFGRATTYIVDLLDGFIIEGIKPFITNILENIDVSKFAIDLIVDGVIGGVGSVIIFTPQLIVLFFFIAILEDSGYMARAALLTDKLLRKMGLTGKSFIPFVVGFGCSVPAIMAARTLDSEKDRKLTIFLSPFMSCGARAPVYAMIASAYFLKSKSIVIFSIYLAGIIVAGLTGFVLSKTIFKGEEAPFILEMPRYQKPLLKDLIRHTASRSKEFVRKAGTIILVASVIVWFLTNLDTSLKITHDYSNSMISEIGRGLAILFKPLGFGDWIPSVAIITGIFAKESVVSTIGILSGTDGIRSIFTPLSAYTFLIFILFYVPCIASIGAMKRELNSIKWTIGAVAFQTGTAWIMAFLVYNIGKLVGLV